MRYFLNRLGFLFISLWAAATANFILPRMMPGNPAEILFAKFQGRMTPQALTALESEFGFNHQPMLLQYWSYLKGLVTGHWGLSFTYYPTPVQQVIASSLPWTLGLVGITTIIAVFVGTFAGIFIASRRGGLLDSTLPIGTMFLQATPYYWLALIFLYVFGFLFSLFPMAHSYSSSLTPAFTAPFAGSVLYHAVLPAATIFFGSLSGWLIGMRNNMIYTLGEDYVIFAEAKGIRPMRLMFSYTARNAILPQVTSFAIALGSVVSGSILTESVFSYSGIGYQLVSAVQGEDYPLIQGAFLMVAASVLVANFLVDLLYARLDPRVRRGGAPA